MNNRFKLLSRLFRSPLWKRFQRDMYNDRTINLFMKWVEKVR